MMASTIVPDKQLWKTAALRVALTTGFQAQHARKKEPGLRRYPARELVQVKH
jgi:hypothetical protein